MEDLFTLGALISFLTLAILEIVLGIDNVIFVSIILGRMPEKDRLKARRLWMVLGILLRSALLVGIGWFGEAISGYQLAGICLVIASVLLVVLGKQKNNKKQPSSIGTPKPKAKAKEADMA